MVLPSPETVVVIEDPDLVVVIEENATVIEVTTPGPQGGKGVGQKGDKGDQGDQGDPGQQGLPGAGFNFTYTQGIPASQWNITHNLNGYPNITTVDSNSPPQVVEGVVEYVNANTIVVYFDVAFSGQAFLS